MMMIYFVLIIVTLLHTDAVIMDAGIASSNHHRCTPITIAMCTKLGYNHTIFPNNYGHEKQEDAGLEVHQFWPLVQVNCYAHLRFFLCAMYTPICQENYDKMILPCREVCTEAQRGCFPLMHRYGFKWPPVLNCDKLPKMSEQQTTGNICAAPPDTPDETLSDETVNFTPNTNRVVMPPPPQLLPNYDDCQCQCARPFHHDATLIGPRSIVGNVSHCHYPCHSPFINQDVEHRQFLTTWINVWAVSCLILSCFTVLTFIMELDRFQYPERPIFMLAFCQMMVSIGYVIRLGYGHELVACEQSRIRTQADGSALCIFVFVLIYFFGMAASVWWIVLALTWLLAAGFKWSSEAIASYAPYFHVFAWSLPTLQTFFVLILNAVDGDPLSGICYVGNTNLFALRTFVLGPFVAYLTLGSLFLIAGFMNLWRIRAVVKKQQGSAKAGKLTQLMSKIGLFSVLYTLPASAVIFALFYESHHRPHWEASALCPCARRHESTDFYYLLALIKYASTLIVGVTSGVWICSTKTLHTWRRLLCCRLHESSSTINHHPHHKYQPCTPDVVYVKSSQVDAASSTLITPHHHHHTHHHQQQQQHLYGSTIRHMAYGPISDQL